MHRFSVKKPLCVLLAGLFLALFSAALPGQTLQIHYINVQQGQSVLIIGPGGTTILFDGGYEGKGTAEVVPYLQSVGIPVTQTLDYIIASHRDTDHFAGLTEVINFGYDAYHVHDNGSDKTNVYVESFLAAAATTAAAGVTPLPLGTVIDLGYGATATCVAANGSVLAAGAVPGGTANENDRSIALLVKYNGFDYFVHGDMGGGDDDGPCTGRNTSQINMESPAVYAIMPAGASPLLSQYGVEVAHVSHHGSESSSNIDYMNLLTPVVGCISVGAGQDASYMHPRVDVVEHVLLKGVPCVSAPAALVLQTEEGSPIGANTSTAGNSVGDIVISTDGIDSYTVAASGAVSQGPDERAAAGLPATFNFEEYTAADNPPVIYNVRSENVTTSAADVAWSTNETATSVVRYGTASGVYAFTASDGALVLNHLLALGGLSPATPYYFVVDSTDETGHTATSAEHTFLTAGGASGHVVISEVYYDTVGTDSIEEWVELYNNSAATVNVGGWTIRDNNGAGGPVTIPAGTTMSPGSYMTVAADSAGFFNLYGYQADFYYGTALALGNSGDVIILRDSLGVEVDAVSYEAGYSGTVPAGWGSTTLPSAPSGSTIVRASVTVDTDTYADWTTAPGNGNPQVRPVAANSVTLTSPNGGESWAAGSAHDITWTSTGTVGSLDLHYSTDGGSTWTLIVGATANDGAYSWTVPIVAPSAACRVRVQEADGDPSDASDADFAITASSPASGVVFSEVYYDTIGTDAIEEWIELYNTSAAAVNIGGWTIVDNNGGASSGTITIPAGTTIAAQSHLTLAANAAGFFALYHYDADLYYGTAVALGNSGDALLLRDNSSTLVDAVAWEGGTSAGVPAGWGSNTLPMAASGSTIVRSPVTQDTDTYADWTTAPGNGNPQTQLKVVFSEVYYDTIGTDAVEEWIELYNNANRTVNIGGCTIVDNNGGASFGTITVPAGTTMAPYSYLTLAANSGGFRNLYHYEADLYYGTAVALGNSGDALLLRGATGSLVDTVAWEGGTSAGVPAGWGSSTLPVAATGSTIVRADVSVDTDTYVDWTTAPGNGHPKTQRRYTLTIAAGAGGTTDPAPATYTYDEGDTVAITAAADAGYRFDSWSGDASGTTSPVNVLMNGDKTVTANFVRQYTLTVAATAGGSTSPVPGTYAYDAGALVEITAAADAGYRFSGWSGDASGTTSPVSVLMDGDKTVTANFIRQYTLILAAGEGGTTSPVPGTYTYDAGALVEITALAAPGWRFVGWSGSASGSSNPLSVTLNSDMTVRANFARQYALTIAALEGGTTSPAPGIYAHDAGALVEITAAAAPGWRFAGWSGDAAGSANPLSVLMDGDKTVTAIFVRQHGLTIAATAGGTTVPAPGVYALDEGTAFRVRAVADPGWRFVGWSGDAEGTAPLITVMMGRSKSVTANFVRGYALAIEAGAGGTTSPVPGVYSHDAGAVVQVQAVPAPGWEFAGWSGDAGGTTNPLAVTVSRDMKVRAGFVRAVKAPLGLSGQKLVNRSLSMIETIVRLSWLPNPANSGTIGHRVYRIENGQALAVADVAPGVFEHVVRRLRAEGVYRFGVTAVNSQGWESDRVEVEVR